MAARKTTTGFDTSILEVSVSEMVQLVLMMPIDIAAMVWGQPGAGKTFTILAGFGKAGFGVTPVLAGCSEPTDFTGIPFNYKDVAAKYLAPIWAYLCSTVAPDEYQKPHALFFDDVVTAHEQTQAALYKLIHERRVGDLRFRDNVRIVAAGNRVDDKSAVTEMPMALGNRFYHCYVKVEPDVWIEWARNAGIHPNITAYIRTQPQCITNFRSICDSGTPEKAFATPRTWEMLSRAIFTLEENKLKDKYLFKMAAGLVGSGIATEFTAFVKHTSKLVPPEEIVKDPKKARVPAEKDIDILHATVSALEHFIKQKKNHKHWQAACKYAMRILPELGLILAKQVVDVIMEDFPSAERLKAAQADEFQNMFKEWGDHLTPVS